ncbi:MAG: 30S ribosomal protein S26e [Candidatus Hodarchaeales archaeon]
MPKKRKSGGRSKGKKGSSGNVQCSQCGKMVPVDKAKRKTTYKSYVDGTIYRELRKQGTQIPRMQTTRYYCVNCAVHRGVANIRAKKDRKG